MARVLVALDDSPTSVQVAAVTAALFPTPGPSDGRDVLPGNEFPGNEFVALDDPASAAEIVDLAEQYRADVVVVGEPPSSFLDRLLGQPVSQELRQRADSPVLVVRDGCVVPTPDAGVLVAVDDVEDGARVLSVAVRLFGATRPIHLLNVIAAAPLDDDEIWTASVRGATTTDLPAEVTDPAPTPGLTPSLGTRLADDARMMLLAVRAAVGGPASEAQLIVEVGDPGHVIEERAEALHAAVIVVGATSQNWLGRLLGTPVSEELLRTGARAVLTV